MPESYGGRPTASTERLALLLCQVRNSRVLTSFRCRMPAPLKNNERLLVTLRAGYLRAGASGRSVLLAVSGGGDSMALLDATASLAVGLRMHCAVGSVDHGLRPEAQRELALVEREARSRRLAFHAARVSVEQGPGLEARARDARYDALQRVRLAEGLDLVATAHTA